MLGGLAGLANWRGRARRPDLRVASRMARTQGRQATPDERACRPRNARLGGPPPPSSTPQNSGSAGDDQGLGSRGEAWAGAPPLYRRFGVDVGSVPQLHASQPDAIRSRQRASRPTRPTMNRGLRAPRRLPPAQTLGSSFLDRVVAGRSAHIALRRLWPTAYPINRRAWRRSACPTRARRER